MQGQMDALIDLLDQYTDDQIAGMSDFTYEGKTMTPEEIIVIVSTIRASRIARGYINGGRKRQGED